MFLLKSLNHKFQMAPNKTKLFLPLSLNSMFLPLPPPILSLSASSSAVNTFSLSIAFGVKFFSLTVCQLVFGTFGLMLGRVACGLFILLIFRDIYVRENLNNLVRFNQLVPGGGV